MKVSGTSRVDDFPIVSGSTVGVIANPMSGRDIRRLVAQASVFPNIEKTSMTLRIIRAAGTLGVDRVLLSTDSFGVAGGVRREIDRMPAVRWPKVEFLTLEHPTGTAADTTAFTREMTGRGAAAVALLGGDGTMRAAVPALGDTPMLGLSTGTNNAFPIMMEPTIAGMALAMVATGAACVSRARAKLLHVDVTRADGDARHEVALVDACVNTMGEIGSRALWKPESLRELYFTFAEPQSVGLSSIAGRVLPTRRTEPRGVAIRCADPSAGGRPVLAPIAPGLLEHVGVGSAEPMTIGARHLVRLASGTVALDGEREIEFGPKDCVTVTLEQDGPRVIDVPAVLEQLSPPNQRREPR